MYRPSFVMVCLFCATLGCGGGKSGPAAPAPSLDVSKAVPADQLKQTLDEVGKTGETGSATAGLRAGIEALNAKDPAKGAGLLKDLGDLEASTNPEEVKVIAKKMASLL